MSKKDKIGELKNQIVELYCELRKEVRKKWKRDLPLEEILFDRWERAKELGFGKGTSIYQNSYVYGNVKVGKNTWIGPFTILDGSAKLTIGNNCSISSGVQIYTHNSVKWAVSKGKEEYERKPVEIESYCFIGPNTIIKNDVKIGKHSIIGASSFVNKNVEPYSIVAGNPAKIIGKVKIKNNKVYLEYFKD